MKADPSILSRIFAWKYWPYYLALLLIVLLVVVLVLLIRRRRRKQAAQAAGEEPKALPRLNLKRSWRAFLRGMPREFRQSIVLYQPYVVFGAAGSGKSELIDRCLDWQGQVAQFHPSYTDDPLLQVYHGKDAVVQELSVVLQGDVSQRARAALIKLWKTLRRGKEPRAVVVLDATGLTGDPADVLVKHAQLIRGKLNILSQVLRRPVKTVLVLTHMDQIPGYLGFADFLGENKAPLSVSFESADALEELEQCLEPFERQLPLALTTRPASEYLQILAFLRDAPKLLGRLGVFVKALRSADPSTPSPQVERLCLTSNKDVPGQAANPLAAAISEHDVSRFRPLRKHRVAAATIAVCGTAYLAGAYLLESTTVAEATRLSDALTESASVVYPSSARERFFGYLDQHRGGLRWLLPSFHASDATFYKQKVRARYVRNLRERVILPRLKEPVATKEMQKKVLFGLALLYASEDNALGRLVLGDLSQWEDTLELPEELIRDYLRYARASTSIDLPLDLRRFDRTFNLPDGADYTSSELFFQELTKATKTPSITREHAQRLRTRAEALLGDVANFDRNRLLAEILDLLQREGGPEIGVAWRKRIGRLPQIDTGSMQKLLLVLRSTEIAPIELKNVHLGRLLTLVRQIASLQDKQGVDLRFTVAGQRYRFTSTEWHDLIRRSRVTLLLQEFTTTKAAEVLDVFFPSRAEYRGLTMGAGAGGGESFFAGESKVNGLYSKKAFEEHVKPAVQAIPELLKTLQGISIPTEERDDFANFVVQELEDYAERYVEEYSHYYRAFRYRIPSTAALDYVLGQVQSPGSPLKKFLSDIEKNTSLEIDEGDKQLEPMLQVQTAFAFVRSLVVKPKGGVSGLESFAALMGKLQGALAAKGAETPADENDSLAGLKSKLSPLGRQALSIYRDADDSFYKQAETWLVTLGIRPQWQEPFLGPIKEAYRLGLREVNQVVAGIWDQLSQEFLQPLRTSFPFDPQSESDITVTQLTEALHPKKGFWTSFKSYLAPLCQQRLGRWKRRTSRFESVKLPASALTQVNELARLRDVLLDAKGNPRPLVFTVKPVPLPPQKAGDYVAVLAFLQAGEATVYAFNQQPSWQEIALKWWKGESAAVGAAFAREGQSRKTYRNLTVSESMWSFYRLLQLAGVPKQKKLWAWNVRGPGDGKSTVTIQFYTKSDPWSIFQTSFEAAKPAAEEQDAGL
jgi:type VI secretion system protein ImpL